MEAFEYYGSLLSTSSLFFLKIQCPSHKLVTKTASHYLNETQLMHDLLSKLLVWALLLNLSVTFIDSQFQLPFHYPIIQISKILV